MNPEKPDEIAVSGASGLIGKALCGRLREAGRRVRRLVRSGPKEGDVLWSPEDGLIDGGALEGARAVVHLAGENVASGRWSPERKEAIRRSRVEGTGLLAAALAGLGRKPEVLVCASAMGFYGDRREPVDENSPCGKGFLAEVCRDWEAASAPAEAAGIRVVRLRIGVVLSREGGALAKMLLPFSLGAGGPVGDGSQPMSWITLEDMVRVILHAVEDPALSGPVNASSPGPVTNREFSRTLGRVLRRPAFLPLPAFAVRLLFGEMGEELLLSGAPLKPARLLAAGFRFEFPELEPALRALLG